MKRVERLAGTPHERGRCGADIRQDRQIMHANDTVDGQCKSTAMWEVDGKHFCGLHAQVAAFDIVKKMERV